MEIKEESFVLINEGTKEVFMVERVNKEELLIL